MINNYFFYTFETRNGPGRPRSQLVVERIEPLGSEEALAGRRHSTNARSLKEHDTLYPFDASCGVACLPNFVPPLLQERLQSYFEE